MNTYKEHLAALRGELGAEGIAAVKQLLDFAVASEGYLDGEEMAEAMSWATDVIEPENVPEGEDPR